MKMKVIIKQRRPPFCLVSPDWAVQRSVAGGTLKVQIWSSSEQFYCSGLIQCVLGNVYEAESLLWIRQRQHLPTNWFAGAKWDYTTCLARAGSNQGACLIHHLLIKGHDSARNCTFRRGILARNLPKLAVFRYRQDESTDKRMCILAK